MSNRKKAKGVNGKLMREQLKRFRRTQQQLLEKKRQADADRNAPRS